MKKACEYDQEIQQSHTVINPQNTRESHRTITILRHVLVEFPIRSYSTLHEFLAAGRYIVSFLT